MSKVAHSLVTVKRRRKVNKGPKIAMSRLLADFKNELTKAFKKIQSLTENKTVTPPRRTTRTSSIINYEQPCTSSAETDVRRLKRQRKIRQREIQYVYLLNSKRKAKSSKNKGRKTSGQDNCPLTITEDTHQVDQESQAESKLESLQVKHEETLINSDNLNVVTKPINLHQSVSNIIEHNIDNVMYSNSFVYDSKVSYFLEISALKCGYLIIKPNGCKPEVMFHNTDAVYLVLRGKGTMQVEGDTCELVNYSHILVKAGLLHSIENKSHIEDLNIYFYLIRKSHP